ncbi:class I SAM-dependent DNA methyltransferase [Primorskyibacter sp. S187A]|uniref:class I SAM-dependent DNA methyltransferase n=1 Tax=Primorskyibacter sp. S187A TaxID=3415130 RepID=UPI003C7CEC3C
MTEKDVLKPQLWTERPVEETIEVYTDWADRYDADVTARGYHTPKRIAAALVPFLDAQDARPVLDFGCGTGISGAALREIGIENVHGTDITAMMLDKAAPKRIYKKLWLSPPGALEVRVGQYKAVVATGVVSLGAAPPETMDILMAALNAGDYLAMSFNDPTLEHGGYDARLAQHIEEGAVEQVFREHGPHLDDTDMHSDVLVLRRL